jgi:drug/metabolite transporter (DMT)-like permease
MGPAEWAMVSALSLIWGGSYLFNAVALRSFAPLTIVALRVSLAAIALWLFAGAMKYPFPRDPALWLRFLAMGILNNAVPFTLIVWSQRHIASGLASVLNATTPLFTVLRRAGATNILLVTLLIPPSAIGLGILFLGERPTLPELIGLLAIGLGLALIDGRLLRRLTSLHHRKPAP